MRERKGIPGRRKTVRRPSEKQNSRAHAGQHFGGSATA